LFNKDNQIIFGFYDMKMTFNQYRIIVQVFKSFGIMTSGHWKNKSFYDDFRVNQLYIKALIFEMEFRLGIYLDDEDLDGFGCPHAIVLALIDHKKLSMTGYSSQLFPGMVNGEPALCRV